MKTLLALTFTSTLCVGYPAITHAEKHAENNSTGEINSLIQRLREGILPGLHRSILSPQVSLITSEYPSKEGKVGCMLMTHSRLLRSTLTHQKEISSSLDLKKTYDITALCSRRSTAVVQRP